MTNRCEPPAEMLRRQWHILESDGEFWMGAKKPPPWQAPASWDAANGVWWNNFDLAGSSPDDAAAKGWRYVAPVTPHAEVDALRAEVARLRAAVGQGALRIEQGRNGDDD